MSEDPGQRRTEEFRSWVFLAVVMAPVLAVLTVSGYGFVVWMWQTFISGPPAY
jgi:nitrate reductase NapE